MSNINFTYEEIAKEVDLKYSTYNPSILLEAIKLVIYGMVNNLLIIQEIFILRISKILKIIIQLTW